MKKKKQLTIRLNNAIYNQLQRLKTSNTNISGTILNVLLNNNVRKSYVLSDIEFCNKITIRLSFYDYNLLKNKFGKNMFTLSANVILEDKLKCLTNEEQKQLKKQMIARKKEYEEMIQSFIQLTERQPRI